MSLEMKRRIAQLSEVETQVQWCDDRSFADENTEHVSPGQFLNRFGWFVLGTTIGGNAIVAREGDDAVYFADHTWYHDSGISYQDLAGDKTWISSPLNAEGVATSLFKLASSTSEFLERARLGEIEQRLDEIG